MYMHRKLELWLWACSLSPGLRLLELLLEAGGHLAQLLQGRGQEMAARSQLLETDFSWLCGIGPQRFSEVLLLRGSNYRVQVCRI